MRHMLGVWLDGVRIAEIRQVLSRQVVWAWTDDALARWREGDVVVSASLPVRRAAYSVGASRPFIEGLLPEGEARTVLEGTYGVPRGDVFGLLQAIGGECAGALQIVEGEPVPDAVADLALTETELEALVRQLPEHPCATVGASACLWRACRTNSSWLAGPTERGSDRPPASPRPTS